MICYKDMTFCTHWETCGKASKCSRPLTDEVRASAAKWWRSDTEAPICQFVGKPLCHTDID